MKGRTPDPTRATRGTGNRPLPAERPGAIAVADYAKDLMTPPAHLSDSAREAWLELVEDLRHVQGIKPMDRFALENLAFMVGQAREMAESIAREGVEVEEETEYGTKKGPYRMVSAYRNHVIAILRLMEQFGLTPAARLRLGVQALEGMTMAEQLRRALED